MKRNTPSVNTLGMLGVAALALGAGFGIARLSQSSSAPAPADAAPTAAEDNGGVQVVAIPDAYLGAAGIAVEAVTSADVAANIGAAGSVVAIPGGEAVVVSRAAGNVTEVLRQVGDKVATLPIESNLYPEACIAECALAVHEAFGALDLNGDKQLEIITKSSAYESTTQAVHEVDGTRVAKRLEWTCGS